MPDTGLRSSEPLDLSLTYARLQEGFLKVLDKGNKERPLPVGPGCQEALRAWLERFDRSSTRRTWSLRLSECQRMQDDPAFA